MDNQKSYRAVDVMYAVHSVFLSVGDKDYAKRKTNSFLRRCGADISKPKEQPLYIDEIKSTVYSMLDSDTERMFWSNLNSRK